MDIIFRRIAVALMASLISASQTTQNDPKTEKMVNLGTHSLHAYMAGHGSSCVVLEVGIGESYKDWIRLLDEISKEARVLCYDRAGYGESEMGPLPRNGDRAAAELKELLSKADIEGPYLLIGHSLGALNAQIFANKNRTEMKGLLLLDPPPLDWIGGRKFPELRKMAEEQTKIFEKTAESILDAGTEEEKKKADFFCTLASEHKEMFSSTAERTRDIPSFGDIPVIVIASGKPNPAFGEDAFRFQSFWNDQCKQLAGRSSRGKYWLAPDSSHHIHRDNPEMVLKAIHELLSEERKGVEK